MTESVAARAGEGLRASLGVRRRAFELGCDLDVPPGKVVALLGPNGAGKSTALQAVAGLLPLHTGSVVVDGACWEDTGRGMRLPVERRRVGVVFQDYLLFPHLSAEENVAFGLRARGVDRRTAAASARRWLAEMGLADHAASRPAALSGGQAQRVALARALAVEPQVLLLDEPLAALDAGTRVQVRADLRHHLADFGGCTLVVTHDPLDAMVLADRLVVLEHGRIVQAGEPATVARSPRTDYVARLVGLNLVRGIASGHRLVLDGGAALTTADRVTGPAFAAFAPSAVVLHVSRPDGSARNVWPAVVTGIEQHADTVRVLADSVGGSGMPTVLVDVTPAAIADLDLAPGREVWAAVKATEVRGYPA